MEFSYFSVVAVGYALLTLTVAAYEARRIRGTGPDVITVFIALFLLECCLPGVVIFTSLPFVDPLHPTDVAAFDRMFSKIDPSTAFLVLGLTAWFVFFFYAFTAFMSTLFRRLGAQLPRRSRFVVSGAPMRLLSAVALGLILTFVSFWVLGDSWLERYTNLILLRAYSPDVERTTLNAYAFSLTQSWAWLAVPALFVVYEARGRSTLWYVCLVCAIALAVLGVSRRAIFIPIVLAYLTLVLFDGRWRLKWALVAITPVLVWVGFGKEIFSIIAFGGSFQDVAERYSSVASGLIRTSTEIGLTIVESLGSISLLDLDPRFGVDHLLSLLRRIPVGWFGWDPGLPTRIVRLSTEVFASPDDQDIPPGLFGQMWLDFGVFGPIFWALLLAVQTSVVQRVFALTIVTRQAAAVFALVTFVVALPLNTGSYDFTFSVDIFALLLVVLLTFRLVRVRLPHFGSGAAPISAGGIPAVPGRSK